jgi:hypothetical protein
MFSLSVSGRNQLCPRDQRKSILVSQLLCSCRCVMGSTLCSCEGVPAFQCSQSSNVVRKFKWLNVLPCISASLARRHVKPLGSKQERQLVMRDCLDQVVAMFPTSRQIALKGIVDELMDNRHEGCMITINQTSEIDQNKLMFGSGSI